MWWFCMKIRKVIERLEDLSKQVEEEAGSHECNKCTRISLDIDLLIKELKRSEDVEMFL